ncbi:hypothetical protein OIU74_010304 [Salix koriyanagi]|uniref:Uncharacterized protein n=1 Tax=Salix koriyanagi TaxID=2511006 RepID=A0A9Q0TC93_9ROSI|nr:hypothetical protein OIU74_010304 [Salix koriyanagi]
MVEATDSKHAVQVVTRRRTRFGAQVTVESADEITEVNKEHNKAVQLEESLNAQDRNDSRQKSFAAQKGQVESEGSDAKTETIKQSRSADLKFVNKVEDSGQFSGEIEKAPLEIGEAVGMVGSLKRKRSPTLENGSSSVGECLAGKPSRELTQRACRGNLEGVDTKTNLQETPSPTSTSLVLSAFASQETPENASQPIVLNEEADNVAGDMEKHAVDAILEMNTDKQNFRLMLLICFPRANRFSSANQSDFPGLENGLERKELGKDMHVESVDVNDCSTKVVDKTYHHPAAGEKMVSFITETNLQEDGDILLPQAAEENQNFFSEVNSGNVFLVSRGTCTHELLHGEETCLSAPEKDTDEGENGSAAIVPIQFTGIGKQRLPFYACDFSEGRKIQHHDEKSTANINSSCKDEKHVLEEENEAAADALPQSSLQDRKEVTFATTTDICVVETTGENEVTTHSHNGKSINWSE